MLLRCLPLLLAVLVGCPRADPPSPVPDSGATPAQPTDAGAPRDAGAPPSSAFAELLPVPSVACGPTEGPIGPLLRDATDAWNLGSAGLALTGNRLAAVDVDNDGYPDLVVHAISSNARETVGQGPKLVWMLLNRPKPGGGRQFIDATAQGPFGLRGGDGTQYRSAQFAVFGDVDNDGDLDAFSGTSVDPNKPQTDPKDRNALYLNDGSGRFTPVPQRSSIENGEGDLWPTTSATFTDADLDGKLDAFVGFFYARYGFTNVGLQAQLYQGTGTGFFGTLTGGAGLTTDDTGLAQGTNHRPLYGVTACDLDGDGAQELLGSAYGRQLNTVYKNDGSGRYLEQGVASGFAADDNQRYQDNQWFACYCTLHRGQADCAGAAAPLLQCPTPADAYWNVGFDDQPYRNGGNTFTSLCADLDDDGDNDVYNAEIHHWWAGQSSDSSGLLKNESTAAALRFTRPGNTASGLAWPRVGVDWNEGGLMAAAGDLDNDGRQDVLVAASDYADQYGLLFHQKTSAPGTFEDLGEAWGFRHPCVSGLAVADFDRDGDLDVVVGSGTARDCSKTWKKNEVHLYENQGTLNHHLLLRLVGNGVDTNRAAIGAKVTVTAGGRSVTREVQGGYGHFGQQNDLVVHVGVAGCTTLDAITVQWPNRAHAQEVWRNLPADAFVELHQGDPRAYHANDLTRPTGP